MKTEKRYYIKRVIIEEYQVFAINKKEAIIKCQDPHTVTVKSETVKLFKNQ